MDSSTKELLDAMSNININSDSGDHLINAWIRLQYIKMIIGEVSGLIIILAVVYGIRTLFKMYCKGRKDLYDQQ
jgi:hypothetical protein